MECNWFAMELMALSPMILLIPLTTDNPSLRVFSIVCRLFALYEPIFCAILLFSISFSRITCINSPVLIFTGQDVEQSPSPAHVIFPG